MKKALVLGGGFTGFTWAYLLAKRGWDVLILEKNAAPGGGIKTLWFNGHPYTHGPRHFVGNSEKAFEFIRGMVPQREFRLQAWTYVGSDDAFYSYPPHCDDVKRMPDAEHIRAEIAQAGMRDREPPRHFEEKWIGGIGETLYRKFMENYTKKHWHIPSNTLLDEHTYSGLHKNEYGRLRSGNREMVRDAYISYPISVNGWDDYFAQIAAMSEVSVRCNAHITAYDLDRRTIHLDKEKLTADLIVSTISPDEMFAYAHGRLPYAGRSMLLLPLPAEYVFPKDICFLYYAGDEPYLRIVEYKKLTGYKSPVSLLGIEQPCPGGKDYPMLFKAEIERAESYVKALPKAVLSVGRLGSYRYMTLSNILDQAFEQIVDY